MYGLDCNSYTIIFMCKEVSTFSPSTKKFQWVWSSLTKKMFNVNLIYFYGLRNDSCPWRSDSSEGTQEGKTQPHISAYKRWWNTANLCLRWLSLNDNSRCPWMLGGFPGQIPWSAKTWWRHQMETFSALLAICAGNSPVPGEFPTQRPVTRSFDVLLWSAPE